MSFLRRRSANPSDFAGVLADVVREAPPALRRDRLRSAPGPTVLDQLFMGGLTVASVSFCVFAVATSIRDPDYFSRRLISSLQTTDLDPITTGTVVQPGADAALPVPTVVHRRELQPSDYQIVMVFGDEAILATDDDLMRAKVGTVLPGLGRVESIVPSATGGTISAEKATLKSGGG